MIISIPKESFKGEKRVALTPESAIQIQKLGHTLRIESGAGRAAQFSDADYTDAGVDVVKGEGIWSDTDIIMKVRGVTDERDRHGLCASLISVTKDGRVEFHGQHRWVPRGGRSRQSIWTIFYRSGYCSR